MYRARNFNALYRRQLCTKFLQPRGCVKGDSCGFAHSLGDLQPRPPKWPYAECDYWDPEKEMSETSRTRIVDYLNHALKHQLPIPHWMADCMCVVPGFPKTYIPAKQLCSEEEYKPKSKRRKTEVPTEPLPTELDCPREVDCPTECPKEGARPNPDFLPSRSWEDRPRPFPFKMHEPSMAEWKDELLTKPIKEAYPSWSLQRKPKCTDLHIGIASAIAWKIAVETAPTLQGRSQNLRGTSSYMGSFGILPDRFHLVLGIEADVDRMDPKSTVLVCCKNPSKLYQVGNALKHVSFCACIYTDRSRL